MAHLLRIVMIHGHLSGVVELSVDGHTNICGTNASGKTTLQRLVPVFYGELPNKVVPKTRMKFDAFYLPHRNSYLVYEYRREAGNVCQAVLTRKQEGGVEYRFIGAPYRPEDYLVETEQGPLALDYTQWASGLRRSGTPVSPKLGATSEFRSVIQNDFTQLHGNSRDGLKLRQIAAQFSLVNPERRIRHIEKLVSAVHAKEGKMDTLKTMLAAIFEEDGVELPVTRIRSAKAREWIHQMRQSMSLEPLQAALAKLCRIDRELAELDTTLWQLKPQLAADREQAHRQVADLEGELDDVSAGDRDYKDVLNRFWRDFSAAIAETSELRITDVLEKINEVLEPHLFPPTEDGSDPRRCPNCGEGRLSMRTARSGGAFIGCSNYPECRYTRAFGPPGAEDDGAIPPDGKLLGEDMGDEIRVFKGRFGPYVQRGPVTEENKKPPRQSVPKDWPAEELELERAVMLLSLPREIGPHPEDGVMVWSNIGRYGPYIKHAPSTSDRGGTNANLESLDEVFTVGMNRAVQLLAEKVASRGGRGRAAAPLRELGEHPEAGGPVSIMSGKYGPYVKWEKINATLPDTVEPDQVTMEQAVELIAERAAKSGKKAPKKAAAKKPAAKKAPAKKTAAKKAPAKKAPKADE